MRRLPVVPILVATALLTAPAAALAQEPADRTLGVQGLGEVELAPDVGTFQAVVRRTAPTSRGARDAANRRLNAIVARLRALDVPRQDITTTSVSLFRQRTRTRRNGPLRVRYTAAARSPSASRTPPGSAARSTPPPAPARLPSTVRSSRSPRPSAPRGASPPRRRRSPTPAVAPTRPPRRRGRRSSACARSSWTRAARASRARTRSGQRSPLRRPRPARLGRSPRRPCSPGARRSPAPSASSTCCSRRGEGVLHR